MKQSASQTFRQHVRIATLGLFAWTLISPVGNIGARSRTVKNQPVILVGIYNYTEIHSSTLHEAETEAAALFAMAGVRIVWVEHLHKAASVRTPPDNPFPDCSVRILNASTMKRWRGIPRPDALGQSFIPSGTDGPLPGGIANVYYDRVREAAKEWGPISTEILGEAIAHELGHLMLGPQHSRQGIMKNPWGLRDKERISQLDLKFQPQQAAGLQRAALSLHQGCPPAVLAKR